MPLSADSVSRARKHTRKVRFEGGCVRVDGSPVHGMRIRLTEDRKPAGGQRLTWVNAPAGRSA